MAFRDLIFQVEQIEQLALIARLLTHHARLRRPNPKTTESLFACHHEPFFNTIDRNTTFDGATGYGHSAIGGCTVKPS